MIVKYSLKNITEAANQFWQQANGKRVFAFHGVMGAGKTTFIHALCDAKGVKDVVGSPTFSIVNEYFFSEDGMTKKIFHIDLYRLSGETEAMQTGVEDCLYNDHICFVEWPDKAPNLLPDDTVHVFIETVNDDTRIVTIRDN